MKAIIIEDQAESRKKLRIVLNKYCPQVEVLAEAGNVEEGIKIIGEHNPELIFLDVHLQHSTAFDLLNKLNQINFKIIFTTAYDKYAIHAFKFTTIDYILKPIDPTELTLAISKCEQTSFNHKDQQAIVKTLSDNANADIHSAKKIVLSSSGKIHILKVEDILRCEAMNTYTLFYLQNGEQLLITKVLKEYEELLSEHNFLRIHKSHLVNMKFVNGFEKYSGTYVTLTNGAKIPVAVRKKDEVLQWLHKF